MARAHIGTSGWSYREWGDGEFYPDGVPQRAWLSYYASRFDTVELNGTFYSLPAAKSVGAWVDDVGSGFKFAVKLSRLVTHMKRLKGCRGPLRRFFGRVDRLGRCAGPLLVRLHPNLERDDDLLDDFLEDVKAASERRWKIAVELRHESWLDEEVTRILDRRRAARVVHDMPPAKAHEPNDASFAYIRRHGPKGDYASRYTPGQIERDAELVRAALGRDQTVYTYYNNDNGGHAFRDARRLRAAVEQ